MVVAVTYTSGTRLLKIELATRSHHINTCIARTSVVTLNSQIRTKSGGPAASLTLLSIIGLAGYQDQTKPTKREDLYKE